MKDAIAPWFQARKPLGIAHEGSFAILRPHQDPDWQAFSHTDVDGYGALIRLLTEHGIREFSPPRHTRGMPPGLWRVIRAVLRQPVSPVMPTAWRAGAMSSLAASRDNRLAPSWTLLSRSDTDALLCYSRAQRVWITSLLLWALHRVVRSMLLSDGGGWLFPVNLRGAYPDAHEAYGNYVGSFYLNLPAATTVRQVQAEILANLRGMRHWLTWYQARAATFLPQPVVNRIYRRMLERSGYLGSFSYGGAWQVDFAAAGLPEDSAVLACAPGSPNHPVANGMIICNGRLSLALRLDPSLGVGGDVQQALLAAWRQELLRVSNVVGRSTPEVALAAVNG